MILKETTLIHATPESVFRYFEQMEDRYLQMHPDHKLFRWVSGREVREGTVFYFEECIAGKLLKKRVVFTKVIPGRHVEFAPTSRLFRFFLPRMAFEIEPQPDGCLVRAIIQIRMGPIAAWLHRREMAAVRQHMHEEGVYLKRHLEQATSTAEIS